MAPKEFLHNVTNKPLWLNIGAMLGIVVLLTLVASLLIGVYTHHGESIQLPDVRHHSLDDATDVLEDLGMTVQVADTGYVKSLPPGTVLEMTPLPGSFVKSGRIIYLTINAESTPTIPLPDIIDNSSYREAKLKLVAMGFKVGEPQYVPGEQDWVYGVLVGGRNVAVGQRIKVGSTLIIQVGNGQRDAADSVFMTDMPEEEYLEDELMEDDGSELEIEIGADGKPINEVKEESKSSYSNGDVINIR